MVIAEDRAQARHIKRFISGLLRETPMLARMIEEETQEGIRLKNRVAIEIHTASYRSTRGYTVIAALLDEVAIWESNETAANPDFEVINAIKPGMATIPGAMLLCASSPYARRGALWEAYRKHFSKDGDPVLVWQAATRCMNPSVPQSFIDQHVADNPAGAMAEYGAQFREDSGAFIARDIVDAAIVPGRRELSYIAGLPYTGFVDVSGGSSDCMALSIALTEGDAANTRRGITALVREVRPPFSTDAVVAEFAAILKSCGLNEVWSDRYAAQWPRESFAVHGITVRYPRDVVPILAATSDIYSELLPALNSRRIELLDDERLITQLCDLKRFPGRGKDIIRHPAGGHDDVINAVAGALVMALALAGQPSFEVPIVVPIVAFGGPTPFTGGALEPWWNR